MAAMDSRCVTFSSLASGRREVPVKSTFIHFDIPPHMPTAVQRSATCPPRLYPSCCDADTEDWEVLMELCHAFAPPRRQAAVVPSACSPAGQGESAAESGVPQESVGDALWNAAPLAAQHDAVEDCKEQELEASDADGISEASTKESSGAGTPTTPGTPNTPDGEAPVQEWTSISSRKRASQTRSDKRAAAGAKGQQVQQASASASTGNDASSAQKYGGKGKGLSHFERIEVGIEDDRDFRVVQRLIGPRGKHMQDITVQCKGAKVWIIGRGSRSWEDSVGPLVVCVGAASRQAFEVATGLVRELLDRVREDHRRFRE
mmetsp:Transcript_30868/g.70164  ORF Transcript_30868/g.70164 Transcript_30868/m.70164 type:complete len:318 (-) Transcript_30868:59-1012(-)